jgi:hypothetical protein
MVFKGRWRKGHRTYRTYKTYVTYMTAPGRSRLSPFFAFGVPTNQDVPIVSDRSRRCRRGQHTEGVEEASSDKSALLLAA